MILVAHARVTQWDAHWPTSLSPLVLASLRAKLPETLLLADDIQMGALREGGLTTEAICWQGLQAGLDWVLVGHNLLDEEHQFSAVLANLQRRLLVLAEREPQQVERWERSLCRIKERKRALRTR